MNEERVLKAFLIAIAIALVFVIAFSPRPAKAALTLMNGQTTVVIPVHATTIANPIASAKVEMTDAQRIAKLRVLIRQLEALLVELKTYAKANAN